MVGNQNVGFLMTRLISLDLCFSGRQNLRPVSSGTALVTQLNKEVSVLHVQVGERKLVVMTPTNYTIPSDNSSAPRSISETAASETQQQGNTNYHSRPTGSLVCRDCGKVFSAKYLFHEHRRIHTDGKPFNCGFCDKQFAKPENVRQHIRTVHNKERPYKCRLCSRTFTRKDVLKDHLYRKHSVLKPVIVDRPKPGDPEGPNKPEEPKGLRPLLPKKT